MGPNSPIQPRAGPANTARRLISGNVVMGTLHFLNKEAKAWHIVPRTAPMGPGGAAIMYSGSPYKTPYEALYEVQCPALWSGSCMLTLQALEALNGLETWTRVMDYGDPQPGPFMDRQSVLDLLEIP